MPAGSKTREQASRQVDKGADTTRRRWEVVGLQGAGRTPSRESGASGWTRRKR